MYTKGKWEINSKHGTRIWIASVVGELCTRSEIIAEVLCNPSCSEDEKAESNAHLIAAAPELLEACKLLIKLWYPTGEDDTNSPTQQHILELARQAISKAGNICNVDIEYSEDEAMANAHLIAAAPMMLEACKKALLVILQSGEDVPYKAEIIDDLNKAIAEAQKK